MRVRIYYEDTDCGGIVYHANYFKYCERARSQKFFEYGLSPQETTSSFVVKSIWADFIKSASLGDELEISTEILELKRVFVLLKQTIHKTADISNKKIFRQEVFQAKVKLGYIDFNKNSPIPIPANFLEVLGNLNEK